MYEYIPEGYIALVIIILLLVFTALTDGKQVEIRERIDNNVCIIDLYCHSKIHRKPTSFRLVGTLKPTLSI